MRDTTSSLSQAFTKRGCPSGSVITVAENPASAKYSTIFSLDVRATMTSRAYHRFVADARLALYERGLAAVGRTVALVLALLAVLPLAEEAGGEGRGCGRCTGQLVPVVLDETLKTSLALPSFLEHFQGLLQSVPSRVLEAGVRTPGDLADEFRERDGCLFGSHRRLSRMEYLWA